MQVILMEKVVNLGGLGDVVKVKDGFARNFLIPQGKAKRATQANLKEFENRRVDLEKKANEQLTSAQEKAAKLEGLKVDIAQKAGVDGRLFGSVTNADIAESLTKTTGVAGEESRDAHARRPAQARRRIPDRRGAALGRARQHRGARGARGLRAAGARKAARGRPFFIFGGAPGELLARYFPAHRVPRCAEVAHNLSTDFSHCAHTMRVTHFAPCGVGAPRCSPPRGDKT